MSSSDFVAYAGLCIASYAAVLSTFTASRDRRDVKISFDRETQVDESGYEGQPFTVVTVANAGRRPVTIVDLYALCLFPRGEHVKLATKPELPEVELKEHQRLVGAADEEELDLAEVEAFIAHDALGHPYRKNVASWYKRFPSHLRRSWAGAKRAYKRHQTEKMVKKLKKGGSV
jgi:hypothetical protein